MNSTKPIVLVDIDHTLFDTSKLKARHDYDSAVNFAKKAKSLNQFLYPESIAFLNYVQKKYTPVIFSEGELNFQRFKVNKTDIGNFVSSKSTLLYPPNTKAFHLKSVQKKFNPLVLVDDRHDIIDVATKLGIATIRVKRGDYQNTDTLTHPTFTVKNLSEIITQDLLGKIKASPATAKNIHLVGIKGVAMTALACILADMDKRISGSDTSDPQITDQTLSKLNITPTVFSPKNIASKIGLVIFSGAYQLDKNPELVEAKKLSIPTINQAKALSLIMKPKTQLLVSGVGGKTTTTSMLLQIFKQAKQKPSWFVGTSQVSGHLPPGKSDSGKHFIAEADEYAINPPLDNQPKFSLYNPSVIICTNLLNDHPDIYKSPGQTLKAFQDFFNKLGTDGLLLVNSDTKDLKTIKDSLKGKTKVQTFGTSSKSDWLVSSKQVASNNQLTIKHLDKSYQLNLKVSGKMNALNATSAFAAAHHQGLNPTHIVAALESFTGTRRRQELIKHVGNIHYYDDYAHHPKEINLALDALESLHPDSRLITIFHPHTYSRTKALLNDFATSFTKADQVIIAPIFSSAREKPDPSISSALLAQEISKHHSSAKHIDSFDDITKYIKLIRRSGDVIITMGAGDIYKIHDDL